MCVSLSLLDGFHRSFLGREETCVNYVPMCKIDYVGHNDGRKGQREVLSWRNQAMFMMCVIVDVGAVWILMPHYLRKATRKTGGRG